MAAAAVLLLGLTLCCSAAENPAPVDPTTPLNTTDAAANATANAEAVVATECDTVELALSDNNSTAAAKAAPCTKAVAMATGGALAASVTEAGTAAAKAEGASAAAAKTTATSASAVAVSRGSSAVSAADNTA